MKLRLLTAIFLSACGFFFLPLNAQDAAPAASSNSQSAPTEPSQPLQLQENPTPADSNAPAQSPASEITPAPADATATNAPAPADTNAQSVPATSSNPPAAPGDPSAPAPDSGMGSPGQNPPPSDPNALIPPPMEPEQPSPVNSAGNEERQRQEQKARYYAVKVKADKEEDLISLQDKATKAKNEEARRQALRQYYDLLAKRMKKIDGSLSDWIDTMHSAYLRRLAQDRLEPTVPLNVPPSPDASGSPAPSPKQADSSEPTPTPKKKRHKAPVTE